MGGRASVARGGRLRGVHRLRLGRACGLAVDGVRTSLWTTAGARMVRGSKRAAGWEGKGGVSWMVRAGVVFPLGWLCRTLSYLSLVSSARSFRAVVVLAES